MRGAPCPLGPDHPEAEPGRGRRQRGLETEPAERAGDFRQRHERVERDRHDRRVGKHHLVVDVDPSPELEHLGPPSDEGAAVVVGLVGVDQRRTDHGDQRRDPDGAPEVAVEVVEIGIGGRPEWWQVARLTPSLEIGPRADSARVCRQWNQFHPVPQRTEAPSAKTDPTASRHGAAGTKRSDTGTRPSGQAQSSTVLPPAFSEVGRRENAARRIRTCNQGIQVAPAFPRGLDYLILPIRSGDREAGRSSAGVIVGTHPASL